MISLTLQCLYYNQVIPEPRCLKNIQERLERGRYKDAMDVYTELSLVFWNALFYNEPKSQIAADAESLKVRESLCFLSSLTTRRLYRML